MHNQSKTELYTIQETKAPKKTREKEKRRCYTRSNLEKGQRRRAITDARRTRGF
jgi:hypothetical protein